MGDAVGETGPLRKTGQCLLASALIDITVRTFMTLHYWKFACILWT